MWEIMGESEIMGAIMGESEASVAGSAGKGDDRDSATDGGSVAESDDS